MCENQDLEHKFIVCNSEVVKFNISFSLKTLDSIYYLILKWMKFVTDEVKLYCTKSYFYFLIIVVFPNI